MPGSWKTPPPVPVRPGIEVRNTRFGTRPIVFHHPGRTGSRNPNRIEGVIELKRDLFARIGVRGQGRFRDRKEGFRLPFPKPAPEDRELAERLTVVVPSNLDEPGSAVHSLAHFGVRCRVVGRELREWDNVEALRCLHAVLPEIQTEYLLVLDSDDTFVTGSPREIVDRFERDFDCELLLAGAQNFWPRPLARVPGVKEHCDRTPNVGGPEHRYVNSGIWLVRTDFYRKLSHELLEEPPIPEGEDQARFYFAYARHHPLIQLDHTCRIFQCEFDEELEWETGPRARWLRPTERLRPELRRRLGLLRTRRGR